MKKLIIAIVPFVVLIFQAAPVLAAPPQQGGLRACTDSNLGTDPDTGAYCSAKCGYKWVKKGTNCVPWGSSPAPVAPAAPSASTATPAPAATSALPASELIRSLTKFSKSCSLKKEVWLQLMQASGCCSKPAEILIVGDGSFTSTGDQSGVIPMGDYYQVELGTVTDWLSFPSAKGYDGSVAQTLAGEDLINWIWLQESQHVIQWDKWPEMSSFKKEEDACKFANENWQKWRLAECNFPPVVATATSNQSSPSGGDWCTQKGGKWVLRPNGANPYWACHTGP